MKKHSSLCLGRAPQHPLSRPSSFRGVEESFCFVVVQTFNNVQMNGWSCSPKHGRTHFTVLKNFFPHDGIKFLKNIRTCGRAVFHQTRLSSFHAVEEHFRLDVMQPCKNIQTYGWAVLPNILCHGPVHFAALNTRFVLMLYRLSTTFKRTAGRAPPNTVPLISRCWRLIFIWMIWSASKTFELIAELCSPKHGQVFFTKLKNLFVWMLNH